MRALGWPARCPWVPRAGEVLCCSHGSLPQLPGRMTAMLWHRLGSPLTSPPTEAEAFLSYCAAWHMSLKLQGLCNINHQSSFLPGLRKPQFSYPPPAALLLQRQAAHTQGSVWSQPQRCLQGVWMKSVPFLLSKRSQIHSRNKVFHCKKIVFIFTNHLSENHQVCNLKLQTSKMARWTSQFETKWSLIPRLYGRSNYDFTYDLKTN